VSAAACGRDNQPMKILHLFVVLAALAILAGCSARSSEGSSSSGRPIKATVAYVVDGDTLRIRLASEELEYVRLVGIDTPEEGPPTECGADGASSSLQLLAPEGATVMLRPDFVADARDRYGRILAHAFIGGRQLEVAQLRRGWAEVYRFEGQRFDGLARFDRAESAARRADRGVWSECGGDFHSDR